MTQNQKFNTVNHFAGAKNEHPPQHSANAKAFASLAQQPKTVANAAQQAEITNSIAQMADTAANEQAQKLKALVTAAQNGSTQALEELCIMFEPLFRKEMKREIFYNALGFEEGLSLARLRFIEIIMSYNGADFTNLPGYIRCRIHFALYDEMKKAWERENNEAALPADDGEANISALGDNVIEREELAILLELALKKLTEKQRNTIKALYFEGYTGKELAKKQKITPAMVSKNHKQALKNLKQNIA